MLATCRWPRPSRARGVESDRIALERGRVDAVSAGLLFMAGMRRSEVSALRWANVADSAKGDGMLVTMPPQRSRPVRRLRPLTSAPNKVLMFTRVTKQIRIQTEALDAFRAAAPFTHLPDATAANVAIKLAAELPERELQAMRYGMRWLLNLMRDGHLVGLDMDIEVRGGELLIRAVEGGVAHIRPTINMGAAEVSADA